eukprot:3780054-Karenia_brevis.AAC.1
MDSLIKAMRETVFPYTTHEAKELFRHYCKDSGSLSRQNGESMMQYISRCKRCWALLKELDKDRSLRWSPSRPVVGHGETRQAREDHDPSLYG